LKNGTPLEKLDLGGLSVETSKSRIPAEFLCLVLLVEGTAFSNFSPSPGR
jgi:hypothetical protein